MYGVGYPLWNGIGLGDLNSFMLVLPSAFLWRDLIGRIRQLRSRLNFSFGSGQGQTLAQIDSD